MKTKIAFDIDGTIADVFTPLKKLLEDDLGRILPPAEQWSLENAWNLDKDYLWQFIEHVMMNPHLIQQFVGVPTIMSLLTYFNDDPVQFVTYRSERYAKYTKDFLNGILYDIPYNVVHVSDKSDFLLENEFTHYVEDRRSECLKLAGNGIITFMPSFTYNQIDGHVDNLIQLEGGIIELLTYKELFTGGLNWQN